MKLLTKGSRDKCSCVAGWLSPTAGLRQGSKATKPASTPRDNSVLEFCCFEKFALLKRRKLGKNQRNPNDYCFGDVFRILPKTVRVKQGTKNTSSAF